MSATRVIANMAVEIAANTAQFTKALQSAQGKLTGFVNNVGKIAGALGVAFGVREVANFALEVSKLAGQAEGVKAAFDRLANSKKVLQDLTAATGGTVSELALMKAAVQANNFQIPIENLAKLFKFATLRAQQTGQSVDYLVESIILGIGRKSPLILDNLGISAVRLREKLNGVGTEAATVGAVAKVVGDIAEEELTNMAGFSENAATKLERLGASWENLKVTIGTTANETGVFGAVLDAASKTMDSFASKAVTATQKLIALSLAVVTYGGSVAVLNAQNKVATDDLKEDEETRKRIIEDFLSGKEDQKTAINDFIQTQYNSILASQIEIATLKKYAPELQKDIQKHETEIKVRRELIAVGEQYRKQIEDQNKTTDTAIDTIDEMNDEIKRLTEEFRNTNVADIEHLKTLAAKVIKYREVVEQLEKLLKAERNHGNTINGLQQKIKDLNEEYEKVNVNDTKRLNAISQEINSINALIKKLDDLRKKRNEDVLTKNSIPFQSHKRREDDGSFSFTKLGDDLNNQVQAGLDKLKRSTVSTTDTVKGALFALKTEWISLGSIIQDVANILESNLEELAIGIGEVLGSIAIGEGSFADFGKVLLGQVGKTLTQLGELLIATGIGIAAFKKSLESLNPAIAIAAGIALVALGSAISGSIKKLGSSSGSGSGSVSSGSRLSEIQYINGFNRVYVEGEFTVSGKNLVAAISNQNRSDNRIKPRALGN